MKSIKAIGKMELPATHSTKVMNPHAQTQQLVVWEIDGERYVVISANTRGTMEFTKLSDLYVDSFDGLLKTRRAPLRIKKADVDTRVFTDELPVLNPVTVPASPSTSDAQLRASARYDAKHTAQIKLKLNTGTDADILKKLSEVNSKQGYIKALIREDLLKG